MKKQTRKSGRGGKKSSQPKEVRNLDEYTKDQEIIEIANELDIALLDHKIPTLKALIRKEYEARGIEERAFGALMVAPKKLKTLPGRSENYTFTRAFKSDEMTAKGNALSAACLRRIEIEEEKKTIVAEFKAKIEAETGKINLLSREISKGQETVLRTCHCVYDFDKATKFYYFDGEQVGQERMTKADYQLEMELK